jgi:hypothetical protein
VAFCLHSIVVHNGYCHLFFVDYKQVQPCHQPGVLMKHGFSLRLKNIIGLSIFAAVMQFPLAADAGCLNWLRQLVGLAPKASITVPAKMASQLGYPLKYKVLRTARIAGRA